MVEKALKKTPLRRCTGCGQMMPKPELIRVVRDDGEVVIDLTNKKRGRGAYVCRDEECLNKAAKNRGIERSLKTSVPKEVHEALRSSLEVLDGQKI